MAHSLFFVFAIIVVAVCIHLPDSTAGKFKALSFCHPKPLKLSCLLTHEQIGLLTHAFTPTVGVKALVKRPICFNYWSPTIIRSLTASITVGVLQ